MTKEQARLKERFLEPETRDGYYIDAKMKAAWKKMLDITEEIVRICDKHRLNYTLAGGTLLGAVRHKGFIPWDDDIDIDMPRKDYDKLLKIIGGELDSKYVVQTFVTDPERISTYLQVRDPQTTGIDVNWANSGKRFNMGIGIDIFPIDGFPETRFARIMTRRIVGIVHGVVGRYCNQAQRGFKTAVARIIYRIIGPQRLWRIREWAFASNDMYKCANCGEYSFLMENVRAKWRAKCYDSYLTVPFEYLDLKIPGGYDEILTSKYGDWRTPSRYGGYHTPLILDVSRPYKQVLVEQFHYKKEWLESLP